MVLQFGIYIYIYIYIFNISIYGGDVNKLKDDLALARPTIFASVPRLFLRLF